MPSASKICSVCKTAYDGGEVFCPLDGGRLITPSQFPAAVDAADPLVGTTLDGRYRVKKRIGEGGMGIVYAAQHVIIDKRVALKVLRDDFSRRPDVVERFRQEAKSASRVANEHIVDISDFGETPQGESYFVMEFLEGQDLSSVLSRETTLSAERAVRIALQCCDALGAAHDAGIVHRDMKPENIFLVKRGSNEDFVKIVDFGIAKMSDIETDGAPGRKLTKTGMIFGTPEYMSPEQASGRELDHRVDVYAMGVILFEMLGGRVPFVGDTFMGILTQQMFEPPPPLREVNPNLNISAALEAVVMGALSKSADERPANMADLAAALRRAVQVSADGPALLGTFAGYGEPVAPPRSSKIEATEPTSASIFPKSAAPGLRKGMWIGLGVVAIIAAVAALTVAGSSDGKATDAVTPEPVATRPTTPEERPAMGASPAAAGEDDVYSRLAIRRTPAYATVKVNGEAIECPAEGVCEIRRPIGTHLVVTASVEGFRDVVAEVSLVRSSQVVDLPPVTEKVSKAKPKDPASVTPPAPALPPSPAPAKPASGTPDGLKPMPTL